MGDEAYPDQSHDEVIQRHAVSGGADRTSRSASQVLTGLFLNVTLSGPQGPAQTYTHTILDRIGYAAQARARSC